MFEHILNYTNYKPNHEHFMRHSFTKINNLVYIFLIEIKENHDNGFFFKNEYSKNMLYILNNSS